ncbi:DUF4389 domain-containing protein [archaeon]|jgi:hypothetical protein|nr:DUF4389 domain-containing protein [archaeon]MBT6182834.1 DUF4389 domain-containing protein [archaeon]MBT6606794.1 DUF4389 domain-containing protein [archaeon]MBT7251733.1 DUF4389 domain-containing protein [archaeon]MBT7660516.1 DUF4389 domain-containing protein [archaeon]
MDLKKEPTGERKELLWRILVAIVSGIILGVWRYLILVLGVVHFLIVLFSGKREQGLADFSEYWNTETYRYIKYLTFVTNERPFPFTSMQQMSKFE